MLVLAKLAGGFLGVFLVTLLLLWAREALARERRPRWLRGEAAPLTISLGATTVVAFAAVFLVMGLFETPITPWLVLPGAPALIVAAVTVASALWRWARRAAAPTVPPGRAPIAP